MGRQRSERKFGAISGKSGDSKIAQDKGPPSLAPTDRPQSPAVRGFFAVRFPQSVLRISKTIAVGVAGNARVMRDCGLKIRSRSK